MKGYGQFCPIAKASEVLGERWTLLLIRELAAGSESFNDLRKGVPLMSPSLLSTRLKSLEKGKVIERKAKNGHVSYKLTEAGEELVPIIFQLGTWGHRWVRSDLSAADLDPSLLIWDMHRSLKADYFTGERTVLKIEFTDQAAKYRHWWLVIQEGGVDVCLKDPGYEVDLTICSDLETLTAVWIGDNTIMKAIRENKVVVTGSSHLRKNIAVWFGSSYFADVKSAHS
ncbi:MAG: winged helix-turn-helix transcriptional regulator [Burkholderiales bacterium]